MSGELVSNHPKEEFFKTPDLVIAKPAIIYPGKSALVSVAIDDQTCTDVKKVLDKTKVNIAMRSRYAQLGLDIHPREVSGFVSRLMHPEPIIPLRIHNHALRPIQLGEATRLMRLFYNPEDALLTGGELRKAIGKGKIRLGRGRGTTWEWATDDAGEITGVLLLTKGQRRWIPKGEDVIEMDPEDQNYRATIDGLLKPLPEDESDPLFKDGQEVLWIDETKGKITLDSTIEGVLKTDIFRLVGSSRKRFSTVPGGIQTNSRLVDSATTWPVRFEIKGLMGATSQAYCVEIQFYQNGHENHAQF
jgi:hypothetical protein